MEVPMPFSTQLQEFLEKNQVAFKHTVHPPAYTAREVASAEHLPPRDVAKVVIISGGNDFQMCVLPANRALDLAELRTALGMSHARLATEAEIARLFPDCDLGAMPPFGNLYNMPVYVDSGLALDEWIAFNAGSHTDVVHIRFRDYKWLVNPVILPLAREFELSRGW
jgi:Ala-tRNA(Pro) deacylase